MSLAEFCSEAEMILNRQIFIKFLMINMIFIYIYIILV